MVRVSRVMVHPPTFSSSTLPQVTLTTASCRRPPAGGTTQTWPASMARQRLLPVAACRRPPGGPPRWPGNASCRWPPAGGPTQTCPRVARHDGPASTKMIMVKIIMHGQKIPHQLWSHRRKRRLGFFDHFFDHAPLPLSHSGYVGDWQNGEGHGTGTWFHPNGEKWYEGSWEGGIPKGHGVWRFSDWTYDGEFYTVGWKFFWFPRFHEKGNATLSDGTYSGDWAHGHKEGQGIRKFVLPDGRYCGRYEGS